MQNVSATFAPNSDARWSDLRVSFSLVDTTAAGNASASATGSENVSQLSQTYDGIESIIAPWATLEYGGWPLDGSRVCLPPDLTGVQTGFWSVLSDDNGVFSTPPALTFDFSGDHSSIGFMLLFDNQSVQYPKSFDISAFGAGDTFIGSTSANCSSGMHTVQFPVSNYRKLVFSFTATRGPYQRVKLAEVIFGIVQNFDRASTTEGSILYDISPTAINLPASELVIKIDNSDRKYNMSNPNGLYSYLQQSQPLDVWLGVGDSRNAIEYVKMGRFFYSSSEAEDDALTAQITAYDPFYQLDKSPCRIGTTGTWTVSAAVAAVIADSDLNIATSIPVAISSRSIRKCIPSDATHREALRLIVQAATCTCYFNRDGVLVFSEIAAGSAVDTLDSNHMSKPAKISIAERVNTVKLTVRDVYAGTESIYTATNIMSGETTQVISVENALVSDGAGVAAWLLSMAQKRLRYVLSERGNPARELGDTVKVYDAYGENKDVIIIQEEFHYNGALSARTRGWG
jgi:hypothetical protein